MTRQDTTAGNDLDGSRPQLSFDEHESAEAGVLIFDGECPFCSAAATAIRRLEGVGAIPWGHAAARSFLSVQFGEPPFALFFVDPGSDVVYAGRAAATELCERAGLPALARDLVGENYEALADAIRRVVGGDDPDPYHGSYRLTPEAAERFDALADAADVGHVVLRDR